MPDATLTRLIMPTNLCWIGRPDKALTPHPAVAALVPDALALIRPTNRA
ncbi:hypothetical protein ACVXG8_12390 [Escherichia coli]